MSTHKFNVGDRIFWENTLDWRTGTTVFHGVVLELLSSGRYSIEFEEDFNKRFGLGRKYGSFTDNNNLKLAGPLLTKEQKVEQKCKKLWNNSKWVKNNPQMGY